MKRLFLLVAALLWAACEPKDLNDTGCEQATWFRDDDGEEVATDATCQRMAGILMRLQQQQSGQQQALQSSFASLQPEAQAAVQQAMESYASNFNNNVVTP